MARGCCGVRATRGRSGGAGVDRVVRRRPARRAATRWTSPVGRSWTNSRTAAGPRSARQSVVNGERDDRVLRYTHVLGAIIVPFLVVAFALLYFFPADTKDYFAWNITAKGNPEMTVLLMGAGYIAGAYFFVEVVRAKRFHRVHVGFLPITAFTIFMAIATFSHLDRFLTDNVAFWIWTALYVFTPILVPLAWLRNRQTDPGTVAEGDVMLPAAVRATLIGAGAVQTAVAVVLLLSPSTMIDIWPWTLTPLTAQVLGGWFALPGVTALMMGFDGRGSAIHITLRSQAIGLALILVAAARSWSEFDTSNELAYVFVVGLGLLLVGLVGLEAYLLSLGRRRPATA